MDAWFQKLIGHVQNTPPLCLGGFQVSHSSTEPWNDWAGWSLKCTCGETKGKVLGHPLKDLDPDYDGDPLFVSPLAFVCSSCGKTTEIIDTKQHGYNSEISKDSGESFDSNYRGTGERIAIPCPHCSANDFSVAAYCLHSHFDLIEDEPELEPRAQEFFDGFDCRGTCSACGKVSSLANFELA